MAEEFQESDVIFRENGDINNELHDSHPAAFCNSLGSANNTGSRIHKRSVPVKIPGNYSWLGYVEPELDGDDGEMVPPHVIIARRFAGKMMAFSVCTGNGGTLKPRRNLSEVRNSILRMTGFIET
ncbi:protein S40-1-like [Henckelia pumila]|uniref:protein S40-1-like n=1 Tax=Henckelia pumila TaxID=405737 RepID=UPI003C6DCA2B